MYEEKEAPGIYLANVASEKGRYLLSIFVHVNEKSK